VTFRRGLDTRPDLLISDFISRVNKVSGCRFYQADDELRCDHDIRVQVNLVLAPEARWDLLIGVVKIRHDINTNAERIINGGWDG
jgi:hypothetical protein